MSWQHLDEQMQGFAACLVREAKIAPEIAPKLASTIADEVRILTPAQKQRILEASPVPINDRLAELRAFQAWMDFAVTTRSDPAVVRAQVVTQNYVCFVYLPEACFRTLAKACPSGSTTKKCAQFLSNNPVRAFRNAVAHANWTYRADFSALIYWARKGGDPTEPLERYEVEQATLSFWQSLSRCVAYAAYSSL